MKGVVLFGKKGKLIPHYVGPCEILQKVGKVAYKLKLPSEQLMVIRFSMFLFLKSVLVIPSVFFLLSVLV